MLQLFLIAIQLIFTLIIGIYFLTQLKVQAATKTNVKKDSDVKYEKMRALRKKQLTPPLSELVRPKTEKDIIGQEEGLKALKAALCGENPQHILIYGNPGIGKTAAARIALEIAKRTEGSPFKKDAPFIEIDATTLRFDERGIADPLIGSVHDPIYQGAGAYGPAGIPQPKMGAVTKAHGGVLFIDEIGELHPVQMNKLLKVLEDRKVFLESSYYSASDENIPEYIHDIFQNGLPADFRLIGATTRNREDIPAALRSRCVEIFFKDLSYDEIMQIISNTLDKQKISIEEHAKELLAKYAHNGRDAVNMLQTADSIVRMEKRNRIVQKDIEWVIKTGMYSPRVEKKVDGLYHIGKINGLGVSGFGQGMVLDIEAVAKKVDRGSAQIKITGIIEEEQLHSKNTTCKRKSMANSSLENVLTVLRTHYDVNIDDYFIHINFTSGIPIDGPSAGTAMFCALYSALFKKYVSSYVAMTGELSVQGKIYPVGGVYEKVAAAKNAGVKKIFIPKANMQDILEEIGIDIIPVDNIDELIKHTFDIRQDASQILHA